MTTTKALVPMSEADLQRATPIVLAFDPGPTHTAYCELQRDGLPGKFGKAENDGLLPLLAVAGLFEVTIVIEKIASYGMPVGAEVFETVYWSGRFAQAVGGKVWRITRKAVVTHLCGSARAKDANVRQALIDRWGGKEAIRKGGPLYGITGDVWAALAIAVAWSEGAR